MGDLTKKELKSVLISGHIIKREQIKINERGNRDALIKEINDSCKRTFGMNLINSHGHAFLSHSDSNKDFLRKLNEHVKRPEDTDPKRDLLVIILQIMLFKSNELSRAEIEQIFANFGCDGPNERVQVSAAHRDHQKTPRQLIQHWEKFGWLISTGKKTGPTTAYSWGPKSIMEFDPAEMVEKFRDNVDPNGARAAALYKAHFAKTIEDLKAARENLLNPRSSTQNSME